MLITKSCSIPLVLQVFLLVILVSVLHGKVVSGQQPAITSSLPDAFFSASSAVNIVEGSVLQLFCTADSSDAVFTWDRGGTVLTNDPPHIHIRSNSDINTVTSILTVDGFTTADNGAYQCSVGTAMATTQMLTAYTPASPGDTLSVFRQPSNREARTEGDNLPLDNRTAVALGAIIDPDGTSGGNTLLRCVVAHTNDTGQPLGSLVWIRNGQLLTTGGRITIIPLVFSTRYGANLRITAFEESDAGIYQCVATDAASSDSDVATSSPFRLDTDLAGGELRLERVSPQLITLTPPNKLVIEVKASGRYREITWSKDGLPFGAEGDSGVFVVDRPNELHNFAEIFVRGDTSESDLGTYTVQLTAFDDTTQTRIPDSIDFQVVQPLMLNSVSYGNNSALVLTDIGEGGSALICQSDSTQCCRASDNPNAATPLGNWYFPDGSVVRSSNIGGDIYITRDTSMVRLNRRNNAQSPTGVYHCEVVDARGSIQTILVDLQTFPPSSPTNLASPSQSPTSITLSWSLPSGNVDSFEISYTYQGGCSGYTQPENMDTVNDGTAREYTLQNLQEFSDYNISVTAANGTGASAPAVIVISTSANVPSGQPQSLMMSSVTSSSITVQWGSVSCIDRNSEITGYTVRYGQTGSTTTDMVSGTSFNDRMFTASVLIPLTDYTFEVAAVSSEGTGPFSTGSIVKTSGVRFQLNGQSYGNDSEVVFTEVGQGDNTLLCLTDNTQCCNVAGIGPLGEWYFPDGTRVLDGQDASRDIYRNRGPSVVRLNRRNNATSPTGVYRCEIPDASGTTQTIYITLAVMLATPTVPDTAIPTSPDPVPSTPTISTFSFPTPTSIALSWEQPAGDAVDRYDIVYTYQGGCSDYTQPENMATVNDGTAREYTLQSLQEFSDYSISVTAVNGGGSSPAATAMATTAPSFPSGPPQSVIMLLVNPRSATIQWGRVSCIDRNSEVTSYAVRYGQTGSTTTVMESVSGTSDSDRMFTASGLIPRTSYTFEVAAVSSEGTGPFSTGTVVTTLEPETLLFQLRLTGSLNCLDWISDNADTTRNTIVSNIISAVEGLCQCGFSTSDISSDGFSECFSSNAVTYRGTLQGTDTTTAAELAAFIEEWTANGVTFPVQSVFLTIDSSCTVTIDTVNDAECLPRSTDATSATSGTSTSSTSGTAAIVAGVVITVALLVVLAVILLIAVLVVRFLKRSSKKQMIEGPVKLSAVNPDHKSIATISCPAYESTAIQSHDYEDLRQYSVAEYEQITVTPDPPPARVRSGAGREAGTRREGENTSDGYEAV